MRSSPDFTEETGLGQLHLQSFFPASGEPEVEACARVDGASGVDARPMERFGARGGGMPSPRVRPLESVDLAQVGLFVAFRRSGGGLEPLWRIAEGGAR